MVAQGPPTPHGGGHSVPPSLLRSNSGLLGGQGVGMPSQNSFPSLVSPRNQFSNMNMLSNVPNVSSLLHQSYGNGGSGSGTSQRGINDGGAEQDPLSGVGTGMGFNHPSSSFMSSPVTANPHSSGEVQGQQQFSNTSANHMLTNQQQSQQLDPQNFEHNQQQLQQFSVPSNPQQQQQSQQQQFQAMQSGLGGVGQIKLESGTNEQATQQLQSLRNLGSMKLEPQQLQSIRNLGSVKMEPQHSDSSLFLHQQQQQQQQQLLLSRQSPQAAAAAQIFHQQRLMQFQQQQQLLKSMPQQRSSLQPQFQQQNLPLRSPVKPIYEPGMCARRLTHYMYQQQHRPEDNNIEFWRKFVAEYFAPNAKKKWCVSMYGSGRQTTGVFPQDVWHCEICNRRPGRGFEATAEVLPRLFKIKYESGTLEELLYVDMPREYQNSSGQIVLDYAKAIQESVFEQLRVVRDGQLRIVFSPDLKICSWEFCARRHEELIPRRLLIPQVSQLGNAAQKCQTSTQNASTNITASELQSNCNMFVSSARQLAKALEVPLVNDLGYTKRYVRCLQISEVVNSMKDLIDYSRETGKGPMESLTKFPRRTASPASRVQSQQPESQVQHQSQSMGQSQVPNQQQPQSMGQSQVPNQPQAQSMGQNGQNSKLNNPIQPASMQPSSNGPSSGGSNVNVATTSSAATIPVMLHQNSMKSRQQNPSPANTRYGNAVQMPPSSPLPQTQPTPPPMQSPNPTPANIRPPSHGNLPGTHAASPNVAMQQQSLSGDADANDSQSSVQKILHDMMSSHLNRGGLMGSNVKNVNGNVLVGNGVANINPSSNFGTVPNGFGHAAGVNGSNLDHGNDSSINGRVGMPINQQQDSSNQLLSSLGAVNGFDDLQFDWKASP
ncbi:transcriptional corepressor SEUSS isoform X2 [Andrographis paniculata]|nr:transcriptional corepressor SEUSS isoform X2 [Andrographis paniculata]XP_051139895.1 transcriptional corepressor SEUSS isoform X2 [Andrographis paniculata]